MTKLRKAWLAVAVTAVITTMTGFIPAASAAPQEGKKISHIGLMVQDMSNPFFSAMERNAKQAAAKIGATLNVQDAQVDLANQNTQIDAFIQQKVDLIIISAVDESGIEPAIQRAKAAGIIVIAVDTPARGADAEIMTNAIQAGETSCEYLFSQMGGKGKVLLVDGTPIQTIIDRIKGCKKRRAKISGYQNRRAAGIPQRPRFQPDGHHRYAHRQSGCLRHFRYERSFGARRSAGR